MLLDILLPERCIGCQTEGDILCDKCISKIPKAERETERKIYACFDYRDKVTKSAIWNLKYYNRKGLGEKLGRLLYESMLEEISEMKMYLGNSPIYVVPVPLSRKRLKERGYNQAEVVARHFCKSDKGGNVELRTDIVFRKEDNEHQARITNRAERLKNIEGAFEIRNRKLVQGNTFIIIDDVTTTGGTIGEIIKILEKNGAVSAVGYAVAH